MLGDEAMGRWGYDLPPSRRWEPVAGRWEAGLELGRRVTKSRVLRARKLAHSASLIAMVSVIAAVMFPAATAEAQSGTMQTIRYGEVVSAEEVMVKDQATGRGAQTGATVGAIAGYAVADSGDRWLGSLLGGAMGGAAGHAAEKSAKTRPGWQLIIRLENGEEVGIQVPSPKKKKHRHDFQPGQRVRLMVGPNGQTQVTPA